MGQHYVNERRIGRVHLGRWAVAAVLAAGIGLLVLGGVAGSDSSVTVTHDDFELTCPSGTVDEGSTLTCTLKNTAAEAKPWPVVAILHLSTDGDRALVRGTSIDVTLGTPSPSATTEGGVTWIGDTLVGWSRFDWSGSAGADPTQTTVPQGAPGNSRTVTIVAAHDGIDEEIEKFYVALGPDGSRGVGLLYNNKASVTLTDDDNPSTDTSLSSLTLSAGQSRTLSTTQATQSQTVAYEVTEATLTAAAARGTTMEMRASFDGRSLDLDGRGGTSIEVIDGQESAAVPLAVGTTTVTLTVTAEDGATTAIRTVRIVRSALGRGVDTVAVAVPNFTLTCPAEVAKATTAQCTLRASGSAGWPVVAVIHSSADGAARALVAEDPIIPDTDPNYSKDVSLGAQQPARTAFNHGYGELFSGGSRTLYRTYGYEKFDWTGTASNGATRTVTVQIHDSSSSPGVAAEVFYVALAPSDYTGFSQLVDNKVPIRIKARPAVTALRAHDITPAAAEVEVEVVNPDGMLYLRYRAGTSGPWTETDARAVTSSPARFSITGLTRGTEYQVQASLDEDFSTGAMTHSFTTLAPSVTAVWAWYVTTSAAEVSVWADDPAGMLYLRYRAGTSGTWTLAQQDVTSSPARFSIAGLTTGTEYQVQASFDEDFSTGVMSDSFTTPVPSVASVAVQDVTSNSAEVLVRVHNPTGTLYLRYRAGTSGTWTQAQQDMTSLSAQFSITGLTTGTEYQVQASFDDNFSTGVMSDSFTTSAPSVIGVEVASWANRDHWYELGDVISIRVTFSEAVVVTGSPTLGIDMDPADWGRKDAVYASGSGTAELTFTHEVVRPNYSTQGIAVLADTLALNGGTIRAAASGADSDLAHSGLDHDPEHKVDWRRTRPAAVVAMTMVCAPAHGFDAASLSWTVPEPPADAQGNPIFASHMIAGSCTVTEPPNARVSWQLSGADAARFEMSDDGTLSFAGLAPEFEAPGDRNGDNVYDVSVTATVGDHMQWVDISVAVTAAVSEVTVIEIEPEPLAESVPAMAVVNGNELTLVFSKDLAAIDDAAVRTLAQSFLVDGARDAQGNAVVNQSPIGIAVDGNLLTLTLNLPIAPGDEATISYYGGLKDISGTAVKAFNQTFTTWSLDPNLLRN